MSAEVKLGSGGGDPRAARRVAKRTTCLITLDAHTESGAAASGFRAEDRRFGMWG